MIINSNLASNNTLRQMGVNESSTQKSLAKLSSGLKINSAADDAAGLAISEKMRGQISGLNKATTNAQDGISLVSTAEGSLTTTTNILQRMRELAVQASSDTNTTVDRGAMQTEMNQLTSEVNRIGNTTSFNTQKLLQGDGKANLDSTGIANVTGDLSSRTIGKSQAVQTTNLSAAAAADSATFTLSGVDLTVNFTASASNGSAAGDNLGYNVTDATADVAIDATSTTATTATGTVDALNKMIAANSSLSGGYIASTTGTDVVITAVAGGKFDGAAGIIDDVALGGVMTATGGTDAVGVDTVNGAVGSDAVSTQASNGSRIAGDVTAIAAGNTMSVDINGITLTATFKAFDASKAGGVEGGVFDASNGTSASINQVGADPVSTFTNDAAGKKAVATDAAAAFQAMIDNNNALKGQFTATVTNGDTVTIAAVKGGASDGSGTVSAFTNVLTTATASAGIASTGTYTAAVAASKEFDLTAYSDKTSIESLVGKGMTINDTEVEFYDATKSAYTGSAKGVDISAAINNTTAGSFDDKLAETLAAQLRNISGITASSSAGALTITAATAGAAGNDISIQDGSIQKDFQAILQVGANTGESLTVSIKDMRAQALDISGTKAGDTITASNGAKASLTAVQSASDGTSNTNTEYTLDISTAEKATAAISVIDDATAKVSAERSNLGALQNRLEHTINNLGTSAQNITTAEANIRDVDMAKEMTNFTKNNILQQASQAMLSQANQQAQGVLQLLR